VNVRRLPQQPGNNTNETVMWILSKTKDVSYLEQVTLRKKISLVQRRLWYGSPAHNRSNIFITVHNVDTDYDASSKLFQIECNNPGFKSSAEAISGFEKYLPARAMTLRHFWGTMDRVSSSDVVMSLKLKLAVILEVILFHSLPNKHTDARRWTGAD
jgi:hypothetical protein